jgi:hypothetical protein
MAIILLNLKKTGNYDGPNFYFFSKMVVWTAPISTSLKLISIGTAQVTLDEKKPQTWVAIIPPIE